MEEPRPQEPETERNEEGEEAEETPMGEGTHDTGILVCHVESKTRYTLQAIVRKGSGQIFVDGESLTELMEQGTVSRLADLLRTLRRERLKSWDIDLRFSDPSWRERLMPEVLAYALNEALANLLSRL
ncbi:MAG: hypothetical protein SLRJCFUN_001900 [Candidatus Fervidibacter sp.]